MSKEHDFDTENIKMNTPREQYYKSALEAPKGSKLMAEEVRKSLPIDSLIERGLIPSKLQLEKTLGEARLS